MKDSILILYYKPTCPFSQKVLKFISENKYDIPTKDVSVDEKAASELLHLGGKKQVPCLFIDDKALYESDAIIEYLKTRKDYQVE
ncbi:MAG: hypothetical protein SP1CHLAM54_08540 [Chlamydiia bacterium]|nr:hypothetical protein [Chlamydiia bacterium]MCH9615760.1 hypothetical protein [Chlamydiia bacterium]MCH9628837.1 hypothetical protein [Chlamydiia bacterium]